MSVKRTPIPVDLRNKLLLVAKRTSSVILRLCKDYIYAIELYSYKGWFVLKFYGSDEDGNEYPTSGHGVHFAVTTDWTNPTLMTAIKSNVNPNIVKKNLTDVVKSIVEAISDVEIPVFSIMFSVVDCSIDRYRTADYFPDRRERGSVCINLSKSKLLATDPEEY